MDYKSYGKHDDGSFPDGHVFEILSMSKRILRSLKEHGFVSKILAARK